jgi:hypothetical protein
LSSQAKSKSNSKTVLIVILALVVVVGLCLAGLAILGSKTSPDTSGQAAVPPVAAPTGETCMLECDIGVKDYAIGMSCESGSVTTEFQNQSTTTLYDSAGTKTGYLVQLDQKQTYEKSKNVYYITGTIEVNELENSVAYAIQASGGAFGNTTQACKQGDVVPPQAAPAAKPAPTLTPIPEYPTLAEFEPTISIPYCDTAIAAGLVKDTYLCMASEAGDFVGNGQEWLITPDDMAFSTMFWWEDGGGGTISLEGNDRWSLEFQAPENKVLTPGIYEDAVRVISALNTPQNGLDVSGAGRGCNQLTGRFEILEIVRGKNNELKSFAANFVQHCEGKAPTLSGYIRLNSQVP